MPVAALPKTQLDAKKVEAIISGVTKVCSVFKDFTEEARDDCIAMAKLHLAPPMPFSWNQARVREFFSSKPRKVVNASPDAEESNLPFAVQLGAFFCSHPSSD